MEKRSLTVSKMALAIAAASVFSAGTAGAVPVVVDFNNGYTNGGLNGQAGGTGLTGNWYAATSSDVVSGDLAGPAGSAALIYAQSSGTPTKVKSMGTSGNDGSNTGVVVNLATAIPLTTTWGSYVMSATGGYSGLGVNNVGTGNWASSAFEIYRDATSISVNGPGLNTISGTTANVTGTDSFIVFQIVRPYATHAGDPWTTDVNVWVNPTSTAAFSGSPTYSFYQNGGFSSGSPISNIVITSAFGSNGPEIDNIRVGTALSDVVVVPEPATLGVLALGSLGLLARKRRSV